MAEGRLSQKPKRETVGDLKSKTKRDMEIFDNFPSTNRRGK